MATMTATRISLELGCSPACDEFAGPLLMQMANGKYDECSVLPIPASIGEWRDEHRTARKRAAHSRRLGYYGGRWERSRFAADIYEINTSATERQGRPMTSSYLQRPTFNDPDYPCPLHGVHYYGVRLDRDGVFGAGSLVAYLWIYRAGDLALVSSILGHAAHLDKDIMYPLFEAALFAEIGNGPGCFVYNRHDSGTDGLRYFKERLGFQPAQVEWLP